MFHLSTIMYYYIICSIFKDLDHVCVSQSAQVDALGNTKEGERCCHIYRYYIGVIRIYWGRFSN